MKDPVLLEFRFRFLSHIPDEDGLLERLKECMTGHPTLSISNPGVDYATLTQVRKPGEPPPPETMAFYHGSLPGASDWQCLYGSPVTYPRQRVRDYENPIPWFDHAKLKNFITPVKPGERQVNGRGRLTHLDGWTVLVFWDPHSDRCHRDGTKAGFAVEMDDLTFQEMRDLTRERFPGVWERLTYPVVMEGSEGQIEREFFRLEGDPHYKFVKLSDRTGKSVIWGLSLYGGEGEEKTWEYRTLGQNIKVLC